MKAIQSMLPGAQEESATEEVCAMCPSLTYQQRMIGFVGCFCLGYLLSFIVSTWAEGKAHFTRARVWEGDVCMEGVICVRVVLRMSRAFIRQPLSSGRLVLLVSLPVHS